MKRQYLSGAQKKRKAVEEKTKISKLPKISTFFKSTSELDKSANYVSDSEILENQTISDEFTDLEPEASYVKKAAEGQSAETSILVSDTTEDSTSLQEKNIDEQQSSIEATYSTDPPLWKVNDDLISYCILNGSAFFRNKDSDFKKSARIYDEANDRKKRRTLHSSLFYYKLENGEIVNREWLLYSPSTGSVYCFLCRLFSSERSRFSFHGFDDWKNDSSRVQQHEIGREYKECLIAYKNRLSMKGRIDSEMIQALGTEFNYWKNLLCRLLDVIKFIATRDLPFRGADKKLGSNKNGNYLGIMELISHYDPFLKKYFECYGNKGKGTVSYLSANICEELIELMGKKVFDFIIDELKKTKYYSICVDSTPDISHEDQLAFTVRYVIGSELVERFLKFIPIQAHGAEYLSEVVISFLEENKMNISDYRGQSYDNAANMSGQYSGLQARLKAVNKYAQYIPCAGHSLNLVGVKAAECVLEVILFFGVLQKLYAFFSTSTHRWQKLLSILKSDQKVVKSLSDTKWSARSDAVSSVHDGYPEIVTILDELAINKMQSNDTRLEASTLHEKLNKFENAFLIIVWNDILSKIHLTNLSLQKEKINLAAVVNLVNSLEEYIKNMREKFYDFLDETKKFTSKEISKDVQRSRKRSVKITRFEGSATDTIFSNEDKLKINVFYPIIDSLVVNIKKRKEAYDKINGNFSFFTRMK